MQNFDVLHPRFKNLIQLHGLPQIEKKEAQTLAEEMIYLKLTCGNTSFEKKLPASLTIINLKILCQRLFKVDQLDQKIYYISGKDVIVPDKMDDDTRPLSYYGVSENGEIIVNIK